MEAYTQYRIWQNSSDIEIEKGEIIDNLNKFLYDMQVQHMEILNVKMIKPFEQWEIIYHVKPEINEEAIENGTTGNSEVPTEISTDSVPTSSE